MAVRRSWATSAAGGFLSVEEGRLAIGSLWVPAIDRTRVKTGFRPGPGVPGLVYANTTPNNSVNISPFQLVLQSSRGGTGGGAYICTVDNTESINILATPAHASQIRHDLIVAQQSDAFYGDADSLFRIRHVVGTPSGTPSDPAVSGSPDYVTLARVQVRANTTTILSTDITDLRPSIPHTVALGGILPVPSQAARATLTGAYEGMTIYRTDRDWIEVHDGTNWRVRGTATGSSLADISGAVSNPYDGQIAVDTAGISYLYNGSAWVELMPRIATGSVNASIAAGQIAGGPFLVNFPAGRFTATPKISLTQSSLPGGSGKYIPKFVNASATSFQAYVYNGDGVAQGGTVVTSLDWIAVQTP